MLFPFWLPACAAVWRTGGVAEWRHKLALAGTHWHRRNRKRWKLVW